MRIPIRPWNKYQEKFRSDLGKKSCTRTKNADFFPSQKGNTLQYCKRNREAVRTERVIRLTWQQELSKASATPGLHRERYVIPETRTPCPGGRNTNCLRDDGTPQNTDHKRCACVCWVPVKERTLKEVWNDSLRLISQDFFVPFYCHNNILLNPAVQEQVTDSPWALLCCHHSRG